ncbi:hypothetical protein [Vibrio sp. SCSIO 43137]|uniref:hypothetical protein n=1 Tax=Vibrio sp. SCSIO 43137 TaxID=3021011 RepID=UPI0023073AB3|nr:hypothetical protein [Vibrio sp. SCSIO 43137]WCE31927.1 hypothetical protein PK654_22655 [Vibrio sp. SCSIO 43137]
MSNLTPQQETALSTFKSNIHLPGGGFHKLIIDLCKEYQLPFQKVRTQLMKAQSAIEKSIKASDSELTEQQVSQAYWIESIRERLAELAKGNQPIMDTITSDSDYQQAIALLTKAELSEDEKLQISDLLAQVYEMKVYKPLKAMLHTTILYWKLKDDLYLMSDELRTVFNEYPQHMHATEHLLSLYKDSLSK